MERPVKANPKYMINIFSSMIFFFENFSDPKVFSTKPRSKERHFEEKLKRKNA